MDKQIHGFKVPEAIYIRLEDQQYITIPAAAKIIRQRFPTYSKENLYVATRKLDASGKILLNARKYELPGTQPRLLIPRPDFEAWLKRSGLGQKSVPHRRGRR